MSRLELEFDCGLAHSTVSSRTHGPATHMRAHGHGGGGREVGNHWEKYSSRGLDEHEFEFVESGLEILRGWYGLLLRRVS